MDDMKTFIELGAALNELKHAMNTRAIIESSPKARIAQHELNAAMLEFDAQAARLNGLTRQVNIMLEGEQRREAISRQLASLPIGVPRLGL